MVLLKKKLTPSIFSQILICCFITLMENGEIVKLVSRTIGAVNGGPDRVLSNTERGIKTKSSL